METLWGKSTAAAVSTAGVTLIVIVPALLIMTAFIEEATQAVRSVDLSVQTEEFARLRRIWTRVQSTGLGANLGTLDAVVKQGTAWIAGRVASQAGVLVRNIVLIFVDLVVMLFAVFFFFRDGHLIMAGVRRVLPFEPEQCERMIVEARDLIHASVTAGLIVAGVQGALGGITFALLGLGAPVFWGVIMAFFSLRPVAGPWIVWVPSALWLLSTGSVGRAVILIAMGAGVVGLVDNFLRPLLLSGRSQLNGLLVFVSLLGGITAFGFLPGLCMVRSSLARQSAVPGLPPGSAGAPPQRRTHHNRPAPAFRWILKRPQVASA
jgi:predicted PurR-regulated permease PerM